MMFTKSYARVIFLIALTIVILLLPNLIRISGTYIGEDPYFYIRVADTIKDDNIEYDELSYSGRPFAYSPAQPLIFSYLKKVLPEQMIINIIPIILGLISLYLFYLILKELKVEPNVNYLSLIILILSPPFIYIFSSYNTFTVITLIILLTFYLLIKKNMVSYLLFFIIPFFGYQYSLLTLILALVYSIKEKNTKGFYIILLISLLSLLIVYLPSLSKYGLSESSKFDKALKYKSLFSDLGGEAGISIFMIFLSLFGLSYLWKSKYKHFFIYVTLILFIILIFYYPSFIIYLSFLLSFLAAVGMIYIIRSKWESETIRKLTMWILILGLIFSSYNFVREISLQEPSHELYLALNFLRGYDSSQNVVFSHYSYGIFINTIANKKNFMDTKFLYAPNLNKRYQDYMTLLYTRNADLAESIINKYEIKYIIITKKMKQGLVWNQEDEGLLFILNTGKSYNKIYYNDEVEVWRIRK